MNFSEFLEDLSLVHLLLIVFFLRTLYTVCIRNKLYRRPPGPRPVPFLGNIHQLPGEYQERAIAQWGKRFGDLIYARFFQTHTIMLNSVEVAQDLLEKRGANYSDRPPFILHTDLMGYHNMLVHARYGDKFRIARRWAHEGFSTKAALKSSIPVQLRETYLLLASLVAKPELFEEHFSKFIAATITEVTYGFTVTSVDNPYVRATQRAVTATAEGGSPASMLVDFIPILKYYPTWMPGAGWKHKALSVRPLVQEMVNYPYELSKQRMAAGTAGPSLMKSVFEALIAEKGGPSDQDEAILKGTTGSTYGAGVETTQTVLTAFILAMVRYPRVFKKAQAEIDRVVGNGRLPDFNDRRDLPYIECILKELVRWHTPLPLGVPHYSMNDDEYKGYIIPKQSLMIANIWGMCHDPSNYPNPDEFCPERFETTESSKPGSLDPRNIAFGFGRRICPGREIADANLYIVMANIIAAMDISKALDERGQEVDAPHACKSGFVTHLQPFKCSIRPRSQRTVELITQLTNQY